MDKKTEKVMDVVRKNKTLTGQPRTEIVTSQINTKADLRPTLNQSSTYNQPFHKL